MSGIWPMTAPCHPTSFAEFVNGKGSIESWREQCCRLERCSQNCEEPSTQIIVMPVYLPAPNPPPTTNKLASIDILEEMFPSINSRCRWEECEDPCNEQSVDPSRCKTTRKHRITFCNTPKRSRQLKYNSESRWPYLPMPRKGPYILNPCPPIPEDEEDSEEEVDPDWDSKDTGTYYFNKKSGKFEPGLPPPPPRPKIVIMKLPKSEADASQKSQMQQPIIQQILPGQSSIFNQPPCPSPMMGAAVGAANTFASPFFPIYENGLPRFCAPPIPPQQQSNLPCGCMDEEIPLGRLPKQNNMKSEEARIANGQTIECQDDLCNCGSLQQSLSQPFDVELEEDNI